MKTKMRTMLVALSLAALPAFAADGSACANDPAGSGLAARVQNMHDKMERIRWTSDANEQRHLMDLHGKLMHEGMQELRKRNTGMACRLEIMNALMDQMIQHQQAAQEAGGF